MSWSIPFNKCAVEDFVSEIDAALEKAHIEQQNPAGVAGANLAVRLTKEIVASGVVARGDQCVGVSLSGHKGSADPGVGDSINISVYQATK